MFSCQVVGLNSQCYNLSCWYALKMLSRIKITVTCTALTGCPVLREGGRHDLCSAPIFIATR